MWKYYEMMDEFKLSVTPSARLFEDHIIYQMKNIISGIAYKTEDHIERAHHDRMKRSRRYSVIADFIQSQKSQVEICGMLSNLNVENQGNYV